MVSVGEDQQGSPRLPCRENKRGVRNRSGRGLNQATRSEGQREKEKENQKAMHEETFLKLLGF